MNQRENSIEPPGSSPSGKSAEILPLRFLVDLVVVRCTERSGGGVDPIKMSTSQWKRRVNTNQRRLPLGSSGPSPFGRRELEFVLDGAAPQGEWIRDQSKEQHCL